VKLIVADMTKTDERISKDLARSDRRQIPVNLIYPPNYPEEPAILLEGLVFASDALKVLERIEETQIESAPATSEALAGY
jgi:thiol:disulfide interchange protein